VITSYRAASFAWNPSTFLFTAEASSLGAHAGAHDRFDLVSHTGRRAMFVLTKTDLDASQEDIYGWHFRCVTPDLTHLTALIIND